MDLRQKLEYQEVIDNYLADHEIYDLFQNLLTELLIDKPEEPLDYLMKKLSKPEIRRVFFTGSSGKVRKEASKELASRFGMVLISAGDLLKEHVEKNGKFASKILSSWKEGVYVKEEIVFELVFPVIEHHEGLKNSYILEGFPRTHSQAIALQRAAIIPDRVLLLKTTRSAYKANFLESFSQYLQNDSDVDAIAERAYEEYQLGIKGVCDEYTWQCHSIVHEEDPNKAAELAYRVLLMKGRGIVLRKPLKVLVIGGPLAGKTTQTEKISEKYGLTLVRMQDVIENAVQSNSDIGKVTNEYLKSQTPVPDKLIAELLRDRLSATDCIMNGWVIDSFPMTYEQCRALRYLKQVPSCVVFLDANESVLAERAKFRRIDPKTGKIYGKDAVDAEDLIAMPEDSEEQIRARQHQWREETMRIHSEFAKIGKSIKAELSDNLIFDTISDYLEAAIPNEITQ